MFLRETIDFFGKPLTIETGRLAKQANGAALVTLGETVVLVTVCAGNDYRDGDFIPLTVDYLERTYAAGKIPGGYFKRESKPTEGEVLNSRIMDRPIRPLFPKTFKYETQIVALVISSDQENDPAVPALIGASAALTFSNVPFQGPIAGIRVGMIGDRLIANPTNEERALCDVDLMTAVGPNGLVMVEGEARFAPEAKIVKALKFAEEASRVLLDLQKDMAAKLNVTKRVPPEKTENAALVARVRELAWDPMCRALTIREKLPRRDAINNLAKATVEAMKEEFPDSTGEILAAIEHLEGERLRGQILDAGLRVDGRDLTTVRPITCEIGALPRTHGSAIFTRGETQALVTVTLGTEEDEQRMDLLTGDHFRRFMLHYNFPAFSVGEVKRLGSPGRREVGHGNLAWRGVSKVLPLDNPEFKYAIRAVSEILESNGSSSMATVCGSSLALHDAGVPVTSHVGGIAMGLIKEGDRVAVLTDILGDEDHLGDMDFKVVGTREGVTAVQMDIKCDGLTEQIMTTALEQARQARLHIIGKLEEAIPAPRTEYSPWAPRIYTMQISEDRIRDLIGPGGRNIRGVQAESGATINVDDSGMVTIAAVDKASADKAIAMIHELTDDAEVGRTYLGEVVKIMDFGAFVRILPGVEGLCHISELSDHRVKTVEDVVKEGDEILVKCIGVDPKNGKIRLSRREAMAERNKA
ncbi:MAG TPA: polyribonucleotide nucleotidyltransferase [Myxococcota bacterium]|nr:polyribonucleotide nucleotidyltransferase [Myxococcota bacterium]HOA14134.1 polyribonucleotide nucleotidyltransferase [Myxococcota bacterium]HOH77305.1 polyribonucleotide nucleotidyltransferase [Myxococcota bacterium]HPV04872.1 polyribonucleotide nucleotidyltransferase [Myxococcota bacterium]